MEKTRTEYNIRYECTCIKAISTAFNIFQLCDYRYTTDSCLLIQHEPQLLIHGTFDFVSNYYENDFIYHQLQYLKIIKTISTKIGLEINDYKNKIKNKDWIINGSDNIMSNRLADEKIFYFP